MPVANMWASVDTTIGQLSQTASELECMLSKLLPFCYANCIKSIILELPFGVAFRRIRGVILNNTTSAESPSRPTFCALRAHFRAVHKKQHSVRTRPEH